MITTRRVNAVAGLHPTFRKMFGSHLSDHDPLQYAVEGISKDEDAEGHSVELHSVLILAQGKVLFAALFEDGGGYSEGRFYADIVRVEEKTSLSGRYHYVEIFVDGGARSFRFDFATPGEVHDCAETVKRLAHLA